MEGCVKKAVIIGGFRHTVESPRYHYPHAELWLQSTSARAWDWILYDWSRWFDIHTIEPNSFYPGIRIMRPDVLAWYYKQGSERPIYFTKQYLDILASRAYPIEKITETFGAGYFGCQLDYMGAMALDEGFDLWILYGVGQPYVKDRTGARAQHWFKHHGTFLYWLRLAKARGVEIVLDTPESNMFTPEMIADEEQYPTPPPLAYRYGYDMGVEREQIREAQTAEYVFD
jgi:hypothetical protein